MNESKISTYLLYAVGEIVLVVVGILIAVQIDDWNNERLENNEQVNYYKGILVDLRKDSAHFASRIGYFQRNLDVYYDIYDQMNGGDSKETPPLYDRLLYNAQFFSLTQQNQQRVIDKLKNNKVREHLNDYFQLYLQAADAAKEYNSTILNVSRPFFLKSKAMKMKVVFHEDKYGFLPRDPILDADKVLDLSSQGEFQEILASLRVSSGYALSTLRSLAKVNADLIASLNDEID